MSEANDGKSRRDAVKKRARRPARGCLFFLLLLFFLALGAGAALWYFKPDLYGKLRGQLEGKAGEAMTKAGEAAGSLQAALPEKRDFLTLYYANPDFTKLVAVKKTISPQGDPEIRVRKAIELLTREGGPGTAPPLPQAIRLKAVYFGKDGVVTLDLLPGVGDLASWGVEGELLAVYSIVNSVADNVDSTQKVRILVGGKRVESLAGHVLIEEPLAPRRDLF